MVFGLPENVRKRGSAMDDYAKYHEINDRLSTGFMFYIYTLYADPGPNVPTHWHEEAEILYTKADGLLILDGKKINYRADDILFINSRQLHSTYHTTSGWAYHILVHPELFHAGNILDDKNKTFHFPERIEAHDPACKRILEDMIHVQTPASDADRLFLMSRLYDLLYYLLDNGYPLIENEPADTVQTGYIKSAIRYIEKNLTGKIPAQSIANEIGISREHLMRLFKLYTGETLNSYIQSHRLEAAKKDLADGYSLTDIVYKYDYSDTAYFCRLFKRHYGMSPGKYKQTQVQ